MEPPVWAIIVAAGRGTRFGAAKQFAPLAGRRVVDWSIDAARTAADGVVLVVPPDRADLVPGPGASLPAGVDRCVAGAGTRSGSVRAGLAAVPMDAVVVIVHDAARPLATPELFRAVRAPVVSGLAAGAVPGVPVTDSLRWRSGAAADRDELVAVQTPQAFAAGVLRDAHADEGEASDDATLVEAVGGTIVVVPGEVANRKITDPADLVVAEAVLAERTS